MGTTAQKLTYLNDTKGLLKDSINSLGGNITSQTTFRQYATQLDSIYSKLPKVSGTGSILSLSPTLKGRLSSIPKGDTKQTILPSGYTQVDYIQSSGTQYIDIGISGTKNIKSYADINLVQLENRNTPMFGSYGNSTRCYLGIVNSSGLLGYSYETTTWSETSITANQRNVIEIDFTQGSQSMKLNGTTILTTTNSYDLNTGKNIYIPGYNNGGTHDTNYPIFIKIYRYKIYEGNTLSRDFIPCYRNSDNEVGVYDLVNNVFYTNQGTGSFTYGSVAPTPNSPLDIQCVTGNQVISVSGKNLFNNNNVVSVNNSTLEITSTGFNVTRTHSSGYGDEFIASYTIENLSPNTIYTFNLNVETENNFANGSIYVYSDQLFGTTLTKSNYVNSGNNHKWNITTSSNGKIVIGFYGTTATQNKIFKFTNIQLEKVSTATTYEAYQGQSQSIRLGNIKLYSGDEIQGTPDNWVINRKIGSIVLDGTEVWNNYSTSTINRFYIYIEDNIVPDYGLCDYFTLGEFANRSNQNYNLRFFVGITSNKNTIQFRYDSITTLANFKTWLSTHNTEVVYKLATPTTEPITDTDLIEDLNELYYEQSNDGTTNISVSGNLSMILTASALKGESQ